jgi:hypothetical protein
MQTNSPLDIGRGNLDGKISNFRLFNKALNADQVKELYDYQKDYFLGSKSQVTLYKGHLGVGVTEPSGQLELAGDERIQEYPPRGLVGDETLYDPNGNAYEYNVEGHGVFKLLSSYRYHNGTGSNDRRIYKLFDKSNDTITHWSSFNSIAPYDAAGGSGAWVTTLDGGSTITAHIAEIQMPYKITLKKYILTSSSQVPRALKTGMIVGSNDGNVFHVLDSVSDFGFTATSQPKEYTVDNTTTPYRIFRLLLMNTNGHPTCNMNEWRLFGTPGPTTLDKGSLTLGRSLDVPRVSRYDVDTETPRPEKLVVDFDTTVNSSPTDISGQGNHGTFYGTNMNYSSADKAFAFNGTDDYIESQNIPFSGNQVLSTSVWVKFDSWNNVNVDMVFSLGDRTGGTGKEYGLAVYHSGSAAPTNGLYVSMYGYDAIKSAIIPDLNKWYHFVTTHDGSTHQIFINGVLVKSGVTGGNVNLPTSGCDLVLGGDTSASRSQFMNGKISNFKLYNVALEPSEVQKLYRLGRTGRSMVISDTAVGIGKVPEAQLDVRGVANFERVGIGTNNPLTMLHVNGASGTTTSGNMNYFSHSNGTTLSEINGETWGANGISIWASDSIMTKTWIISHNGTISASDHRIKKDIIDVNDASALETLRLLKPKKYSYKDNVARDKEPVWGFIAQEVGATLPYSTQLRRETIPNIYELANVSDSNVITFTNFDTSTLESNTFVMKVFDTKNNEHMVNLTEVIDEHNIRVDEDLSEWIGSVDETGNVVTGNQIFVYGQQVDDFTFLKKDAIWTVSTAALQEVDRQLQNEKIRNDTLETQVSDLLARVTALENA